MVFGITLFKSAPSRDAFKCYTEMPLHEIIYYTNVGRLKKVTSSSENPAVYSLSQPIRRYGRPSTLSRVPPYKLQWERPYITSNVAVVGLRRDAAILSALLNRISPSPIVYTWNVDG